MFGSHFKTCTSKRGRKRKVAWEHSARKPYQLYKRERRALIAWLYLLRKGQKAEEVGEIVGVCRRTIQRWLRWYRKGGLREMERWLMGGYRGRRGRVWMCGRERAC